MTAPQAGTASPAHQHPQEGTTLARHRTASGVSSGLGASHGHPGARATCTAQAACPMSPACAAERPQGPGRRLKRRRLARARRLGCRWRPPRALAVARPRAESGVPQAQARPCSSWQPRRRLAAAARASGCVRRAADARRPHRAALGRPRALARGQHRAGARRRAARRRRGCARRRRGSVLMGPVLRGQACLSAWRQGRLQRPEASLQGNLAGKLDHSGHAARLQRARSLLHGWSATAEPVLPPVQLPPASLHALREARGEPDGRGRAAAQAAACCWRAACRRAARCAAGAWACSSCRPSAAARYSRCAARAAGRSPP